MSKLNKKKVTAATISICKRDHADVWRLTSELLLRNVFADEYIVYVPQCDVSFFREITNKIFKIEEQESLGGSYYDILVKKIKEDNNQSRTGWYLQQFYKIEALLKYRKKWGGGGIVAIWDADCVPVKKIALHDSGNPIFMNCSSEYHKPYFDNIDHLLAMKRVQDQSFVIPGFPFKTEWVDEFIRYIESKNAVPWYQAIINSTDFSLTSGLSETEMLGTWMANSHPLEWKTITGRWERFGQSRFGVAKSFTIEDLNKLANKHNLDIISFENWDIKKNFNILKKIRKFFFIDK